MMCSNSDKIQVFMSLLQKSSNIFVPFNQDLAELGTQLTNNDDHDVILITQFLEKHELLLTAYQQALDELTANQLLAGTSQQMGPFRVTPSSEPSLNLPKLIEQEVKRNTKLTVNTHPPETKPDTKLDTKIEDSEKPLS